MNKYEIRRPGLVVTLTAEEAEKIYRQRKKEWTAVDVERIWKEKHNEEVCPIPTEDIDQLASKVVDTLDYDEDYSDRYNHVIINAIKEYEKENEETPYTKNDCIRTMYDCSVKTNVGCIGIIKIDDLNERFKKPKYQLFMISAGFGSEPENSGNAVFGIFCADGESCRMEKYQFIGIANERVTQKALKMLEIAERSK